MKKYCGPHGISRLLVFTEHNHLGFSHHWAVHVWVSDPLMGALFWVAFLPSTIRWQQLVAEEGAESGQLLAWHPWSGERMDNDVYLIARWQTMVFHRIEAKRNLSCIWLLGRSTVGARGSSVACQARSSQWRGTLGSHLGEKASFTHELPRRRQATMAAFYSVGQLWYESRVSWRLKRCFFISRVVNTALSGIEAFCPSKAQYQALTSLVTCLARRVIAGAAARRREHGRIRTLTNQEVLRFWKLAPCDVEARVRRLKWAQDVGAGTRRTMRKCSLRCSGKLPAEPSATLSPVGEITPEANPWAVRWMEDLEALQPYDERCVVQRMGKGREGPFPGS